MDLIFVCDVSDISQSLIGSQLKVLHPKLSTLRFSASNEKESCATREAQPLVCSHKETRSRGRAVRIGTFGCIKLLEQYSGDSGCE
jgi:hypothetical protein